ncbi:MAG: hypothetical protein V4649_00035 [Bacteroidota bacterium]
MAYRICAIAVVFLLLSLAGNAQVSVDTTGGNVIVTEKQGTNTKTLRIYRSFGQKTGRCHKIIYQPDASEYGEEPTTLKLNFSAEAAHIKTMLDAAMLKKQYNFSQFSISILPYTDLVTKLTDIYSNSPEWNAYLKKAGSLKKETVLFDGSVASEIGYDQAVAAAVLDKSDFLKQLSDLFLPYGYKLSSAGFPDEHQQVISSDQLMLLGKNGNLIIPVPTTSFVLTKVK